MRSIFRRANGTAGSISDWAGALAAATVGFGWVSKHVPALGPINWAEALFLGLGAALLVLTVLSLTAIGWRMLRPLPKTDQPPATLPDAKVVEAKADTLEDGAGVTFDPRGMVVTTIHVDAQKLEIEHVIEIAVVYYNATGSPVELRSVSGYIQASANVENVTTELGKLSSPIPLWDRSPRVSHWNDAMVVLEQAVRPAMVKELIVAIEQGRAFFYFNDLNIMFSPTDDNLKESRLPIWSGATLTRQYVMPFTGRLILASANLVMGASSSV